MRSLRHWGSAFTLDSSELSDRLLPAKIGHFCAHQILHHPSGLMRAKLLAGIPSRGHRQDSSLEFVRTSDIERRVTDHENLFSPKPLSQEVLTSSLRDARQMIAIFVVVSKCA